MALFNRDGEFAPLTSASAISAQAEEQSVEKRRQDVFESHRHRVFSVAFYMSGNELEAERILTETFVQAFQEHARPDASTIDRALVCRLRARFSFATQEPPAVSQPPQHPLLDGGRVNIRRNDLEEQIRNLPPEQRLTFLLRDVEGYPAGKVAELLRLPESQVRRSVISARVNLRNLLAELPEKATEAA